MDLKITQEHNNDGSSLINASGLNELRIDADKLEKYKSEFQQGSKNFLIFQQYSSFFWPTWLFNKINTNSELYCPTMPFNLINDMLRDGMAFNNLFSNEEIYLDPTGMISVSYDQWSVEIWILHDNKLYRSAESLDKIKQKKDPDTAILKTVWEDKAFSVEQKVFGARSSIDEAVVDITCSLKMIKPDSSIIICLRPYNQSYLGGLRNASFEVSDNLISLNGSKSIFMQKDPSFVISGKEENDINIFEQEDSCSSQSLQGMATLALGYNLKKGVNNLHFRVALQGKKNIAPGNYNLDELHDDFSSFMKLRLTSGANISISDKSFKNCFYTSKANSLHIIEKDYRIVSAGKSKINFKDAFFIVYGYNRMGYVKESEKIIDTLLKEFTFNPKKINFKQIINGCYTLCSISDFFIHERETDYLQKRYELLKNIANALYKTSQKIKNLPFGEENSIPEFYIKEDHTYDLILLAYAIERFSYLARCLGIFGDELKFKKESERLTELFLGKMAELDEKSTYSEFMFYLTYGAFPFRLSKISDKDIKNFVKKITNHYKSLPLNVSSYGWDLFNTLLIGNALLHIKDHKGYELIQILMNIGGDRYSFPDYINPVTGKGCWGKGPSKIINAMFFLSLRNLIFIDAPERLEVFPVPSKNWFKPGSEIILENAPSRFGKISLRMICTSNEIQLHFEDLPKYVPPDIMIHLPEKVKIIEGEDFVIKKEEDTTFVINGWPSLVRFIRK